MLMIIQPPSPTVGKYSDFAESNPSAVAGQSNIAPRTTPTVGQPPAAPETLEAGGRRWPGVLAGVLVPAAVLGYLTLRFRNYGLTGFVGTLGAVYGIYNWSQPDLTKFQQSLWQWTFYTSLGGTALAALGAGTIKKQKQLLDWYKSRREARQEARRQKEEERLAEEEARAQQDFQSRRRELQQRRARIRQQPQTDEIESEEPRRREGRRMSFQQLRRPRISDRAFQD